MEMAAQNVNMIFPKTETASFIQEGDLKKKPP
jgi:hypothetical protein